MKNLLTFTVFIFLTFNLHAQGDEFILDTDKAGFFKRNMLLEDALEIAKSKYEVEKTTISLEGDDYIVYKVNHDGELLLKLEPGCINECILWRIWVYSALYRTNKGIGIGSTIQDVLEQYTFKFLQTEGKGVFLLINENDIAFEIDPKALSIDWWRSGAKFEDIPKETKVIMIIP